MSQTVVFKWYHFFKVTSLIYIPSHRTYNPPSRDEVLVPSPWTWAIFITSLTNRMWQEWCCMTSKASSKANSWKTIWLPPCPPSLPPSFSLFLPPSLFLDPCLWKSARCEDGRVKCRSQVWVFWPWPQLGPRREMDRPSDDSGQWVFWQGLRHCKAVTNHPCYILPEFLPTVTLRDNKWLLSF